MMEVVDAWKEREGGECRRLGSDGVMRRKEDGEVGGQHRQRGQRRRRKEVQGYVHRDGDMQGNEFKKHGLWAFDQINPNCGTGALDFLANTAADFVCLQETKRFEGVPSQTLERDAKVRGWTLSAVPCGWGEKGGPSAGVAVAARRHIGMAKVPDMVSSGELEHRFCVRWTGSTMKGGLFIASVYLYSSELLSSRNVRLLEEVARVLLALLGP